MFVSNAIPDHGIPFLLGFAVQNGDDEDSHVIATDALCAVCIGSKTVLHDSLTDLAKRFLLGNFTADEVDNMLRIQAVPYSWRLSVRLIGRHFDKKKNPPSQASVKNSLYPQIPYLR